MVSTQTRTPQSAEDVMALEDALLDEPFTDGAPLPGDKMGALQRVNHAAVTVKLYDRRTGVSSDVIAYGEKTIRDQLAKVDTATDSPYYGKKIFTARSPETNPELFYSLVQRGTHPCLLNPKHERFEEVRTMGFRTCKRDDFPNAQEADAHARIAHIRAYPRLKEAQTQRLENEKAQREQTTAEAMLKAIEAMSARAVSAEVSPATPAETRTAPTAHFTCDQCDYAGDSAHALTVHKGRAHKPGE